MFTSRRKVPAFASVGAMAITLPAAALLGGAAYGQDYTGTPNYTINDTQTVYDGIGNVTPLPGGTSVLERVLYAVDQLNLTSPGSIAPVNGVYANIAESVAQREWYSTDRTEVAYQDYVADVITTQTDPLTVANMVSPPAESDFTFGTTVLTDPTSGNTVDPADLTAFTVHLFMWRREGSPINGADDTITYYGTSDYTLGDIGSGTDIFADNPGFSYYVDSTGVVHVSGPTITSSLIAVIEYGGQAYLVDAMPTFADDRVLQMTTPIIVGSNWFDRQVALTDIPFVSADGSTIDLSSDLGGNTGSATWDAGPLLNDSAIVWEDGVASLRSVDYIATNGLESSIAQYSYDIVTPTDFTRQLDSFFVDWNQREFSTVIDGSVTNVITGVTEATERAVTAAGTAVSFTAPTIDIGDITTTVLGAVNTGDITVGVNSAVDEASTRTTRGISASLTVVGGSAETGAMMLNIAHNSSVIRGNVENTLVAVNGSVGDISTTALGAVNTGTITNAVNAAVQGIVGMAGQY